MRERLDAIYFPYPFDARRGLNLTLLILQDFVLAEVTKDLNDPAEQGSFREE